MTFHIIFLDIHKFFKLLISKFQTVYTFLENRQILAFFTFENFQEEIFQTEMKNFKSFEFVNYTLIFVFPKKVWS